MSRMSESSEVYSRRPSVGGANCMAMSGGGVFDGDEMICEVIDGDEEI